MQNKQVRSNNGPPKLKKIKIEKITEEKNVVTK